MPAINHRQVRRFSAEPKLLSRQAAAAMLGDVHIRTVDRLLKQGALQGVKVGRRSMVTLASAEDLAAAK